jgi:hypothetical protein
MEQITLGRHSRRQIDKELTYYVQAGKLAMVHCPKVKSAMLKPRTRWGVSWGHYREQTMWRCPYTGSEWRSKSFTVMDTPDETNYIQFLQIDFSDQQKALTKKAMALPSDRKEMIDIILPTPRKVTDTGPPKTPIVKFTAVDDYGLAQTHIGGVEGPKAIPKNSKGGGVRIYTADGTEVLTDVDGMLVTHIPGTTSTANLELGYLGEDNDTGIPTAGAENCIDRNIRPRPPKDVTSVMADMPDPGHNSGSRKRSREEMNTMDYLQKIESTEPSNLKRVYNN